MKTGVKTKPVFSSSAMRLLFSILLLRYILLALVYVSH